MNLLTQILNFIPKRLQFRIFLIFVFMLITIFMEVISLGLIFPIISIILEQKLTFDLGFGIKDSVNNILSSMNSSEIFYFPLIFLLAAFLIKTIFSLFYSYFLARQVYHFTLALSKEMFFSLFRKNLYFFFNKNSNAIIREICYEVQHVFKMGISPLFSLIVDILLTFSILVLIFISDFKLSIFLLFFFTILLFGYYFIIKKKLDRWSNMKIFHESMKMKNISHFLNGLKVIRLYDRNEFFFNKYFDDSKIVGKISVLYSFIKSIPRILLELLLVFFLVMYLILEVNDVNNLEKALPFIAFLTAACLRLVPCINRMMANIQDIKFILPSINLINSYIKDKTYDELKIKQDHNKIFKFNNNIIFKDVAFKYESKKEYIFKSMNCEINQGDTIGIIGESGKGKTTFVELLCGFFKTNEGTIQIDGQNIENNISDWQSMIGYIPQETIILDDTLKNNVTFGEKESLYSKEKFLNSINISELDNLILSLNDKENTRIGEKGSLVSSGQAQRVGLARAIYNSKKIMIFDEFTSSLDVNTEDKIIQKINNWKKNKTIFLISHRESTMKYCDKIFRVNNNNFERVK